MIDEHLCNWIWNQVCHIFENGRLAVLFIFILLILSLRFDHIISLRGEIWATTLVKPRHFVLNWLICVFSGYLKCFSTFCNCSYSVVLFFHFILVFVLDKFANTHILCTIANHSCQLITNSYTSRYKIVPFG